MQNACYLLLTFLGFFYPSLYGEENFILIHSSSGQVIQEFGSEIEEQQSPASSFKIPLSLMAYDAGILENTQRPTWEFQEGYEDFLESWRHFQTPQSWMTHSCVWFSKCIALKLGFDCMERYLALFKYGNQDISSGLSTPKRAAWINGSLKISTKEQVYFLQAMLSEKLAVSDHALLMTKQLLFKEELLNGWKLFGKTGLTTTLKNEEELSLRWFVGWLEKNQETFPFAYLLQKNQVDPQETIPRVKQLLSLSFDCID